MRDPRVPINRDSIRANEAEIRQLLRTMAAQTPMDVRGIAVMSSMLSDGSGPLYNHQRGSELQKVLHEVSSLYAGSALFSDVT